MAEKKTNKNTEEFAVSRVPTTLLCAVHMKGKDLSSKEIADKIDKFVNKEEVLKCLYDTSSRLTNIASEDEDCDILNVIIVPRIMMPANDDQAKIITDFADSFMANSANTEGEA